MKVSHQTLVRAARTAAIDRLFNIELLEQRVLLSGLGDGTGLRKAKFFDSDGDKVKVKLSGKDTFDITFTPDGDVDTITLHSNMNVHGHAHLKPAKLSFKVKPLKHGLSDGMLTVNSIVSTDPDLILAGISATNVVIANISLVGGFSGALSFNNDVGNLSVAGPIDSLVIQGGHDLVGNLSASHIGQIIVTGGDILGNITTTDPSLGIDSIQANNLAGNVEVMGALTRVTLAGDLSGSISFGTGTLTLLVAGNVTETGSVIGLDSANISAGDFTRLGVIGNFAGTIDAGGTVGLGVGGGLLSTASVSSGGDLTVKAGTIAADLTSTAGDVAFAMTTGGFAGTVMAADDVRGNGANGAIIIRGGDFTGTIIAGTGLSDTGDVAAISFLPSSGGFSGTINTDGMVGDINANFFSATTSITGASLGNLTANRATAGDAISLGATFTATNGSIGNITARAIGSIGIGGSFNAIGDIGNISATSTGNTSADHAISGASFIAGGTIGTVTASAKAGSGINDSTFTAATAIGDISATSVSGNGFRASADGLNLFTVTNGDLNKITGSSTLGDGFHGGTFTASGNIGAVLGTSASGNGIGDATGAVSTAFTATAGQIASIAGRATGGFVGSGGDGIVGTVVHANQDADGLGVGSIAGSSQFGTGIAESQFSVQGDIRLISGTTNNSNPTIDKDGILNSVFRTASDIGNINARTGVSGGAGIGTAIEGSTFSAAGSMASSAVTNPAVAGPKVTGETFADGDVFLAIGEGKVQWRHPDGTLVATLDSGFTSNREDTGMAFDSAGNLYVTMFGSDAVTVFAPDGSFLHTFGAGYDADPESILFDPSGNVFVGQADGTGDILKFDAAGNFLTQFDVDREERGSDWIDLAADQSTMFYTSEGNFIHRFDVSANSQLSNFNPTPLPGSNAYAFRIVPSDGGILVADTENILRLDSTGNVVQTYDAPGKDFWFALNLDPDGKSFWSGVLDTGDVYKFDIATGNVLQTFNVGVGPNPSGNFIAGVTVKGEITVSAGGGPAIVTTGDVLDSRFLAGYDIGDDLTLDGTGGVSDDSAASTAVTLNDAQITGDWINSFATAGIETSNAIIGDGDDTLHAPGSSIGNIGISSNIAGDVTHPGSAPTRNFQSDAIGNISADAIGIDPNSGSVAAPIKVHTDFSNGILGTIGSISANTSTQRQAIGDGSQFNAGTTIDSIIVTNTSTSFNMPNAIGQATFEANTSIGDITVRSDAGMAVERSLFIAHGNSDTTHLAIGNIVVNGGIESSRFDASDPIVAQTALNIGTVNVTGTILGSRFEATGDIARGVRLIEPSYVTTADVNGDSNLDLVVLDQGTDSVSILLGDGLGGFGAPQQFTVGDQPIRVIVADVDGSASPDLIVLNGVSDPEQDDSISVLLGNGDGTFESQTQISLGTRSTPTDIAIGDWIEDGKPDLAITDGLLGTVTILRGLGDGTFTEATVSDLAAGTGPSAIVATAATGHPNPPPASFNADGHIDLAVTNHDSDNVSIFLGNVGQANSGTGTFSDATNFTVGDGPAELAIGSFNSTIDSRLDLVVANELSNNVSVLIGNGNGGFANAVNYSVGTTPVVVLVANMNGDAKQDLVVLNGGSHDVSVLLGDGLGGFGPATHVAVGSSPVSMVSGDFNNDGFVDVAVANHDSGSLTVLFGDGTGHLEARNIFTDPTIIGITVEGAISASDFVADSDLNHSGALAAIGGIHVTILEIDGSNFSAGSNDETSFLAIGPVNVEPGALFDSISASQFSTGTAPDLNIGAITVTTSMSTTSITATGNIGDLSAADTIGDDSSFRADSDGDDAGDIGSISAANIFGATFSAHNVALSDAETMRAITVTTAISGLNVTASGSIGDLNSSGESADAIHFTARENIGDINVTASSGLSGSEFLAGQLVNGQADPLGAIGDIHAAGTGVAISSVDFVAGSGGIGDITASGAAGILDCRFRAAGTPDSTHLATIGNITVMAGPDVSIADSVFSALGSIGTGTGNTNGFNIETTTGVDSSQFLAGYDIGANLLFEGNPAFTDDALGAAITFINKINIGGNFTSSDLIAGVNPVDNHFGNSNDIKVVQGSSIGSFSSAGMFVTENPLMDRNNAIEADLIGAIHVGGNLASLPGVLNDSVNVKVL